LNIIHIFPRSFIILIKTSAQADISEKKANMSKTSSTVKAMQREVQGVDMEIGLFFSSLGCDK
jgi:hypothetical protein